MQLEVCGLLKMEIEMEYTIDYNLWIIILGLTLLFGGRYVVCKVRRIENKVSGNWYFLLIYIFCVIKYEFLPIRCLSREKLVWLYGTKAHAVFGDYVQWLPFHRIRELLESHNYFVIVMEFVLYMPLALVCVSGFCTYVKKWSWQILCSAVFMKEILQLLICLLTGYAGKYSVSLDESFLNILGGGLVLMLFGVVHRMRCTSVRNH